VQVFFYITAKNKSEAKKIATILVKKKLVACANVFKNIQSFFLWKNNVNNSNEVVIMGKTLQKNQPKVISEVKKIHSYDIPCVVFYKISSGNKEFLNWINKSVK
tara:strand:- start:505 stop:816 length:312 start_codon:yes stop_codon:yes gene_type:complete